ncbi:MAG: DNA polymerase I [Anaerolineales bacterium]|nr:DNA polymerase I [Anaerolineales bacterium]MCW5856510.1 DNA polymerase I [Anaerolineales bacterium]
MPATLYLIDGHALAYRTYFALTGAGAGGDRWTTSKGEPTAGVFGFTSVLLRILEQDRPDYMAVAFDRGRTFRDDLFADYKATREKMPDDLRAQIDRIRELVDAFNIPRLELDNYEADDILGSVARKVSEQGIGVKIITGDKDLLQLVSPRVIVSLPGKSLSDSKDYYEKDVQDYLGVLPEQVVDFKALVGDKSDNIPGVPGIGEKSAADLLNQYKTLEGIYAHLDELKPAQRKKLEENREKADLSYKLARIVTDLEIDFDPEDARTSELRPKEVEPIFQQLEFRALMGRLNKVMEILGVAPPPSSPTSGQQLGLFADESAADYSKRLDSTATIVDTPGKLAELVETLRTAKLISFDTETTGTQHMSCELVGLSFAVQPKHGYYVPVGHELRLGEQQLALEEVLEAVRGPLSDPKIPKVGHNLSFDTVVLARYGVPVTPLAFDSMIAEWLADPGSRNLGLKNLAWVRLNLEMTEISELLGSGRKQITMAQVPIEKAGPYAAADAEVVLRLMPVLEARLDELQSHKLLDQIEMPLVPVLTAMEQRGILLDIPFLQSMSSELEAQMGEMATSVYQHIGEEINLNSPQQLAHALFDRLQIEPPRGVRKTATGSYSTAADILDSLRDKHPIVPTLLDYRELSKLKSTYLDALPNEVNAQTGRVHTSYNQTGTVTGRIASSEPNLQNIPIRTDLGRRVRRAFIAAPGHVLLSVDYSQIELRIVAHIADDEAMLDAFRAGQDIHVTTAAAILGLELEQVSGSARRNAKAVNFGLIYGMSPFGLTRSTDLTLAEAEDFVKGYFERFPKVKAYIDNTKAQARETGYVETLLGRRRYFPGLKDGTNYVLRSRLEREAINSPIQGTAADIMKLAMLRVAAALPAAGLAGGMLLQVHDELVLEVPESELEETARLVTAEMTAAYTLKVPLAADAKWGKNWGQMENIPLASPSS